MRTNRTCMICQTKYYYCSHCDEALAGAPGFEPWKILVHDENCRKILNILQKHSTKVLSTKEAKELLQECDLSVIDTAQDIVKNQVKEIMDSSEPEVSTKTRTSSKKSG